MPTHVEISPCESGLPKDSTIMCEQMFTINTDKLGELIGKLNEDKFEELNKGISISVGI